MSTRSLAAIQDFNPRYLEINLVDASGRLVASSEVNAVARPSPDRIATAFNLDGKNFVSEPKVSPFYKRVVVYVGCAGQGRLRRR